MTVREAITEATRRIERRDAEQLLLHTTSRERAWLLAHPEETLDPETLQRFQGLVERRGAREPLQYLTGTQEFYGLALRVTPDVLIPRPETEHLVESILLWSTGRAAHALAKGERTLRIADIGTGSGAIVIALATHLAGARFTAIDLSAGALEVARENAAAHACDDRIEFLHGNLLDPLAAAFETGIRFDVIASNPPYVALADAPTLQPEVVAHEPHGALFAGDDGLAIYRRLIPAAFPALHQGGLLALEIGSGQQAALASLLKGWDNVRFVPDLQGIPRVALAERP